MLLYRTLSLERATHHSRLVVILGSCEVFDLDVRIGKRAFQAPFDFARLNHAPNLGPLSLESNFGIRRFGMLGNRFPHSACNGLNQPRRRIQCRNSHHLETKLSGLSLCLDIQIVEGLDVL